MATLVFFHAHPDDEAIATGGLMATAADAGHRVVLVVATRGEHGEPVPGVLAAGEPLWRRRVEETHLSARILGVSAVHFLGYVDSGMMGAATNALPESFWQAELADAAARLAAILAEEGADLLSIYDDHGTYGHPDHVKVHHVGVLAASLAGLAPDRVFEATVNRDHVKELRATAQALADDTLDDEGWDNLGVDAGRITHRVDVRVAIDRKRRSMAAHASQIAADDFFLTLPVEQFARAFGDEWYIRRGHPRADGAPFATDVLGVLA